MKSIMHSFIYSRSYIIYTMLHGMQTLSSNENYVCPSVCQTHCDKTEQRSVQIFILYERSFSLVFWQEEWLMAATTSTWNFGSIGLHWNKIANFEPIFARSTSAITPDEKSSIDTNMKSTACFPLSLRWSSNVAPEPPKGGQKTQNGWFPSKIALRLKEVCCKVSLCENC